MSLLPIQNTNGGEFNPVTAQASGGGGGSSALSSAVTNGFASLFTAGFAKLTDSLAPSSSTVATAEVKEARRARRAANRTPSVGGLALSGVGIAAVIAAVVGVVLLLRR